MLLRGADLDDVINEWFGNDGDVCKGRQMPVHYSLRSHQLRLASARPSARRSPTPPVPAMAARIRKRRHGVHDVHG